MRFHRKFIWFFCLASYNISFSWLITGNVQNSSGNSLSGVRVSVEDSSQINTETDSRGYFSLSHQPPTALSAFPGQERAIVSWDEHTLQIRGLSIQGLVHIRLISPSGQNLWNALQVADNGALYLKVPQSVKYRTTAVTINGIPFKANQPLKLLAAASSLPRLRFRKAGYKDTVFQMTADTMRQVNIVLKDTGTAAPSCPTPALSAGTYNRTVSVRGENRSYILRVPSAYKGNTPVPLVVDFHPLGGSGSGQMNQSPYKTATDPEGVITVYPDGKSGPSGGAWNVGPCCVANANDTAFARALVADVQKSACIDPKRVYAVGFSMGGGMSHYVACHLADIFAAVAPAAFDLLEENQGSCRPSRPIPVLSFRSTGDFVVKYEGGSSSVVSGMPVTFLGAQNTFKKWAQINQCSGNPSSSDANGCSFYTNCASGVQVGLCTKQGGGHDQGNASVGWPWLKKFTLP